MFGIDDIISVGMKVLDKVIPDPEQNGYRLTPEGILPGSDKLKAVRDSKPPSTVQEIRQFFSVTRQEFCYDQCTPEQIDSQGSRLERGRTPNKCPRSLHLIKKLPSLRTNCGLP